MPIMVLYIVVSTTITGLFFLMLGAFAYALLYVNIKKRIIIKLAGVVLLIILLAFGYLYHYRVQNMLGEKVTVVKTSQLNRIELAGIQKRLTYWGYYGKEVIKNWRSFFFGNAKTPDRAQHTSAHNYYLDFIYHFGFLSFIPLLVLTGATLHGICRKRRGILASPELTGITIVVLYLLFVENMLKVGMRQPYPGIFTFFLWGILISKLSVFSPGKLPENEAAVCRE